MQYIEALKRTNILVDTEQLTEIVNTILQDEVSHIVKTAMAAIYPLSEEGKALKKRYIAATSNDRYINHNMQSADNDWGYGDDTKEKTIPSFKDYAASNLVRNTDDRHYFSTWDEDEGQYTVADKFLFVQHEAEYIEHEVDMEALRSQVIDLKNLIIKGENKEAKDSLDMIIESFASERTKEPCIKNNASFIEDKAISTKPKFSELVEPYINQLKIKANGTREYKRHMEFFEHFLGEYSVDQIVRKHLDDVMGTFANMPLKQLDAKKGGAKANIYKNYSLEDRINIALETKVEALYLPSTEYIKSPLKVLRDFFRYLMIEGLIEINPVPTMIFDVRRESKNKGYKRTKFTKTQANKIITHCANDTNNELHWAALIMAYTGARNGEVMQLRREDVLRDEESEILYFRITDKAGSTKTEASNRIVPVHNKLIELGFETFYIKINSGKIFTRNVSDLSNWFNKLRGELDIPPISTDHKLLDLYSFRHTVRTMLSSKNQSEKIMNAIAGHSNKDMGGTYTHIDIEYIQQIKDVIEHITY